LSPGKDLVARRWSLVARLDCQAFEAYSTCLRGANYIYFSKVTFFASRFTRSLSTRDEYQVATRVCAHCTLKTAQ